VDNTDGLWTRCTASLREQVSDATWQMWLSPIEPLNFEGSSSRSPCPTRSFESACRRAFCHDPRHLGDRRRRDISVELQVSERETPPSLPAPEDPPVQTGPQSRAQSRSVARNAAANRETPLSNSIPGSPSTPSSPRRRTASPTRPPNPWPRYPAGPTTPVHLRCLGPGENPSSPRHWQLCPGELLQHRILYVTTETFLNDFVDALRMSATIAFKRRYRECDVLLIDDIQFMENKEGLQEEFFHTYNDLHGAGKQIVLTSDRAPRSIETLEDRLRSRFLSGLITEIDPRTSRHAWRSCGPRRNPTARTSRRRLGVHRHPCEGQHPRARRALIRVTAFASLNGSGLARPRRARPGRHRLSREPRRVTPQMILDATAASYGFSVESLIAQAGPGHS